MPFQTLAARFQLFVLIHTLFPGTLAGHHLFLRHVEGAGLLSSVSLETSACGGGRGMLRLEDGTLVLTHRPDVHRPLMGLPTPLLGVYYDCPVCGHRVRPVSCGAQKNGLRPGSGAARRVPALRWTAAGRPDHGRGAGVRACHRPAVDPHKKTKICPS